MSDTTDQRLEKIEKRAKWNESLGLEDSGIHTETALWLLSLVRTQAAEIERLKGERDEARGNAMRAFGETAKMLAERAGIKITDDYPCIQMGQIVNALLAAHAALRAALKKIDTWLLTRPAGIHWAGDPRHDEIVVLLSRPLARLEERP